MIDPDLAAKIESCSHLFLREIREPKDNALVVVVDEAIIGSLSKELTVGDIAVKDVRDIEVTDESRSFELSWETYIAYSVRNESFAVTAEGDQIGFGHKLRIYEKSRFLDYLAHATWGDAQHPGALNHVSLVCLNHVVDIAAVVPPKIRQL